MMPTAHQHRQRSAVPRQRATPDRIRDLCYQHLAALKAYDCAPVLLEERPEKHATLRDSLTHHKHCRSSTALLELASTCYGLADEISRTHRLEVAELRKELASVKRCVVEWDQLFSLHTTPSQVHSELHSLRCQVKDLTNQLHATKHDVQVKSTHCVSLMHASKQQPIRHGPLRVLEIGN